MVPGVFNCGGGSYALLPIINMLIKCRMTVEQGLLTAPHRADPAPPLNFCGMSSNIPGHILKLAVNHDYLFIADTCGVSI